MILALTKFCFVNQKALTDSHSREIGDYDALVIVQSAGFDEGELLLYERLQMGPMLLSRYARDGSEKARRQMLAMCQGDPEILADVLGCFVAMVSAGLNEVCVVDLLFPRDSSSVVGCLTLFLLLLVGKSDNTDSDDDSDDEVDEILCDIQEVLSLAQRQGVLPPVRIARILAGEGTGQFSSHKFVDTKSPQRTVPLSVALDYVGEILDESRSEISRLKVRHFILDNFLHVSWF